MARRTLLAALAASAQLSSAEPFAPSTEVAAQRGPLIFNAVYDSLRKWGAVVHPNGMSVFLATVPEGVMLHHGNNRNETPTELDWLAYEIEHSEMFARPGRGPPGAGGPPGGPGDLKRRGQSQVPLDDSDSSPADTQHGWLHTYRTTRPLQFLYIDGMSGNKDDSGVLDTQDILLRGVRDSPPSWGPRKDRSKEGHPKGPAGEHDRALELCQMCAEWGLQGVIRTESPGSEIIKCDFFDGLEQIQSVQRSDSRTGFPGGGPPGGGPPGGGPPGGPGKDRRPGGPPGPPGPGGPGGPGGWPGQHRSEADRNREIYSSRTLLDYSSMVSPLFFPVNISNPDSNRTDLPRLTGTTKEEMAAVKEYLIEVVNQRRHVPVSSFNWRDIADLVVRRYADKLTSMVKDVKTVEEMAQYVRFLVEVYIDYSEEDEEIRDAAAKERCATFYSQTMPLNTDADHFINAAFKAVNSKICTSLFNVRSLVITDSAADEESLEEAKATVKSLMSYLAWNIFE